MDVLLFYLFWLGTFIGMVGTILNARHVRKAFLLWVFSNVIGIVQNITLGSWNQVGMFTFNLFFAVYGYMYWIKNEEG
jgi:nicotinamide riboside transporter PnuC